jgi:hypothetical protein
VYYELDPDHSAVSEPTAYSEPLLTGYWSSWTYMKFFTQKGSSSVMGQYMMKETNNLDKVIVYPGFGRLLGDHNIEY